MERIGFILPEECKTSKRSYCRLQVPDGRTARWQSQALHGWAQGKVKEQETQTKIQEIPIKYKDKVFLHDGLSNLHPSTEQSWSVVGQCAALGLAFKVDEADTFRGPLQSKLFCLLLTIFFWIHFPMSSFLLLSAFQTRYSILKKMLPPTPPPTTAGGVTSAQWAAQGTAVLPA